MIDASRVKTEARRVLRSSRRKYLSEQAEKSQTLQHLGKVSNFQWLKTDGFGYDRGDVATLHKLRMDNIGRPYGVQLGCRCGTGPLTTDHLLRECPVISPLALQLGIGRPSSLHESPSEALQFARGDHLEGCSWGIRD